MNILLLNDNPVVTKLVTLSAQKTSDELDIVSSIEDIKEQPYDLFVLDDAFYKDDIISVVKAKTSFSSSLYICSRDAEEVLGFGKTLKKPFLPTDLVEIFAKVGKNIQNAPKVTPTPVVNNNIEDSNTQDELVEEEFAGEELDLAQEIEIPDQNDKALELDELEDFEFDDELSELEELDDENMDEILGDSILDSDEVQEVQNLLDEVDVEFNYDIEKVATELSFSSEALIEFLEDFIVQAKEYKGQLYGALDLNDYETLHSIAHKLKGVAANLSITEAFDSLVVVNQSNENDLIKDELDKLYIIMAKLNEFIHHSVEAEENEDILEVTEQEEPEAFISEDVLEVEELDITEVEDEVTLEDELEQEEQELVVEDALELEELESDFADELQEETPDEDALDMEELEIDLEDEITLEDEEIEDIATQEDTGIIELENDLEDELSLDEELDEDMQELPSEEVLDIAEEELPSEDSLDIAELESDLEDEITLDDEEIEEEVENEVEEVVEESSVEPDLETQIESAVLALSEDDLASELDVDTMMDNIAGLDTLTSDDIKLAIGESDNDSIEEVQVVQEIPEDESLENSDNDGVEALKTLLSALSDKNVAASLKGMKININITLGDK